MLYNLFFLKVMRRVFGLTVYDANEYAQNISQSEIFTVNERRYA